MWDKLLNLLVVVSLFLAFTTIAFLFAAVFG